MTFAAAILAGLGLLIGSFIGLVTLRLPQGLPVTGGRSRCGGCARPIGPVDLVPVGSWLALRGRCRRCRAPIPTRYPLIELACACIGLWAGLHGGAWPEAAATALLGWLLLALAVIDAEHFWLPDVLTLPLLGAGLIAAAVMDPHHLLERVIGAAAGFVVLWLIAWAYRRARGREGLGDGDPVLLAAIGAWVGWMGLPSVLLWASLAGLSLVLARATTTRRIDGSEALPFGVFLAIGGWLTWLYGPLGL